MKVIDLLKIDGVTIKTNNDCVNVKNDINNIYICDLFSWVMGHVKEENTVLLTVLSSINAVAVAVLLDIPAVIFCEGVVPAIEVIEKANQEGICLFTSEYSSAITAIKIARDME